VSQRVETSGEGRKATKGREKRSISRTSGEAVGQSEGGRRGVTREPCVVDTPSDKIEHHGHQKKTDFRGSIHGRDERQRLDDDLLGELVQTYVSVVRKGGKEELKPG